jgi:hypothetical protein
MTMHIPSIRVTPLLLSLGLMFMYSSLAGAEDGWRYVVPPPGDPFEHPPLRAITLSETKPADVAEEVQYRGRHRRYTQLRYGSPNSVRVTVVVDEIGPKEVDLYVDTHRARRITAEDRVAGEGLTWRVPLELAIVKGIKLETIPRTLIFRFGTAARILSFATAGYLEGGAPIGDQAYRVRRQDGDGNGFFTNPQDRLWIDLDHDGRWDGAREQFLYAPILTIGAQRYAVHSDELGRYLALDVLAGTGKVRLRARPAKSRVIELGATLIGRDGSAISLQGTPAEAVVPAGEYRLGGIGVAMKDPKGGLQWSFVFTDNGGLSEKRWHRIDKDSTVTIDPIGKLEFRTGWDGSSAVEPNQELKVQPKLYTEDGLLIVTCIRGTPDGVEGREGAYAEVVLTSADGQRQPAQRCGFA